MLKGNLRRALALVRKRTHRGALRHVVLYEKEDCHLCAEAFRALARIALELPIEIERVDVAASPAFFDRYALRVPVVAADARELDAAGVGEEDLRAFLNQPR